MTDDEIKLWATAYVEAQIDRKALEKLGAKHPNWWAVEKFMNTGVSDKHSDADHWKAILQILALDPPKEIYGVTAAGPLEDFIENFGVKYIDKIEHEAKFNLKFRRLLGGVWERSTPEVWARIERIRGEAW